MGLENVCTLYQCTFTLYQGHGSPRLGPPVFVTQLAAKLVNCMYSVKITQ